jgi:hypothetical protein
MNSDKWEITLKRLITDWEVSKSALTEAVTRAIDGVVQKEVAPVVLNIIIVRSR